MESHFFNTIGPCYEIVSCFIQNSQELSKLQTPLMKSLLTGKYVGAHYYLWPIGFDDGHDYPGYVERDALFALLGYNECAGIPTRFPHNTHMYKFFASKEWTCNMCLNYNLKTPLTTKVPRSLVATDANKAAKVAIAALSDMAKARSKFPGFADDPFYKNHNVTGVNKGVAKLGRSWEALDVRRWKDEETLARALVDLAEQQGSRMEFVLVQEWVDFDIEVRNYIVHANLADAESLLPKGELLLAQRCRRVLSYLFFQYTSIVRSINSR